MSGTKLLIPQDTVVKLKDIAEKFGQLNTGATGDNFWIGTAGDGSYDWEQVDIGVNKAQELIVCRQSGCSCNGPEEPTADTTISLSDNHVEVSDDSHSGSGQEAVTDLIKTTDTLYKVLNDGSVSPQEVIGLPNAEIRRAVVELVGYSKIVDGAEVLDESETDGRLMRIPLAEDEDIVLVHVKDPSTTREYFLRVPPKMKTARQARAWTFGFEAEDFILERET